MVKTNIIEGRTLESIMEFSLDSRSSRYARTLGGLLHAKRRRELLELRLRYKGLLDVHECLEILCNKDSFHLTKTSVLGNADESKAAKNLITTTLIPLGGWEELALQLNGYLKHALEDSAEIEKTLLEKYCEKLRKSNTPTKSDWIPLTPTPQADGLATPAANTGANPGVKKEKLWVSCDSKVLRKTLGLSQQQLADILQIPRSTYQHFESVCKLPTEVYKHLITLKN